MKAHRSEQEVFAPEQKCVRHEEDQEPDSREQQERHRDQIDEQRQQRGLDALEGRGPERHRHAGRIGRVVHMLDLGGDLVGEEAGDKGRHRRHDEDRAGEQSDAQVHCHDPEQHVQRCVPAGPRNAFQIACAFRRQPGEHPLQSDAEHDQHQDREPDGFQQHRAKGRREHLGQGFGGVGEHVWQK